MEDCDLLHQDRKALKVSFFDNNNDVTMENRELVIPNGTRKNMVKIVIENDSNDDHMEEANAAAEDYSSSGVVRGNSSTLFIYHYFLFMIQKSSIVLDKLF